MVHVQCVISNVLEVNAPTSELLHYILVHRAEFQLELKKLVTTGQ